MRKKERKKSWLAVVWSSASLQTHLPNEWMQSNPPGNSLIFRINLCSILQLNFISFSCLQFRFKFGLFQWIHRATKATLFIQTKLYQPELNGANCCLLSLSSHSTHFNQTAVWIEIELRRERGERSWRKKREWFVCCVENSASFSTLPQFWVRAIKPAANEIINQNWIMKALL